MTTFTLYVYIDSDTPNNLQITNHNFWRNCREDSSNLYVSQYCSYVRLATHEVELAVPTYDPVTLKIEALEGALKKEVADSHVRQTNIKDQIQTLKAIGYEAREDLNDVFF